MRLNENLYVRLLDVNAKRRKENRIYVFILSFNCLQCAPRHTTYGTANRLLRNFVVKIQIASSFLNTD